MSVSMSIYVYIYIYLYIYTYIYIYVYLNKNIYIYIHLLCYIWGVSINRATPKSSLLIHFNIIFHELNHPAIGVLPNLGARANAQGRTTLEPGCRPDVSGIVAVTL